MHPTGLLQLTHGGINDGISGQSILPGLQVCLVIAPVDAIVLLTESALQDVREMMQDHHIEIAPDELIDPGLHPFFLFIRNIFIYNIHGLRIDMTYRENAQVEIGGEHGCSGYTHKITFIGIFMDRAGKECFKLFICCVLSGWIERMRYVCGDGFGMQINT